MVVAMYVSPLNGDAVSVTFVACYDVGNVDLVHCEAPWLSFIEPFPDKLE